MTIFTTFDSTSTRGLYHRFNEATVTVR